MQNNSMTFFMYLLTLILMLLMVGCSFKPKVGPPWMQDMLQNAPEGPPKFQLGWRDGCETGISATSNAFQKHFYSFKQDYQLARDREYYTGWKIAYTQCQRYVFQYLRRNII